jgi:hypothetical protein
VEIERFGGFITPLRLDELHCNIRSIKKTNGSQEIRSLFHPLAELRRLARGYGVLFRSDGVIEMRRNLVWFGYIKGVFMIDARAGCMASSSLCAVRGKREADSPAG